MYECIQVGPHTHYIKCPAQMGIYVLPDGGAWLIDSGSGPDAAKKLIAVLKERGWQARGIVNTHSHADHIGGNRLIQERLGCPVYAPPMERAFVEHPILEPSFLFAASPPKALRKPFLMAQPSKVTLSERDLPPSLSLFDLPGHSFGMVGVRTEDGVCFLADSVVGEQTLLKYPMPFMQEVEAQIKTLHAIQAFEDGLFIPAHAEPQKDIRPLAQANLRAIDSLCREMERHLVIPRTAEELLTQLFIGYGLSMDIIQHALAGTTVRACLVHLEGEGRVAHRVVEQRLVWEVL